jgi:hypothetical protein
MKAKLLAREGAISGDIYYSILIEVPQKKRQENAVLRLSYIDYEYLKGTGLDMRVFIQSIVDKLTERKKEYEKPGEKPMKTITIGYERDDGDFAILATLNNQDDRLAPGELDLLAHIIRCCFIGKLDLDEIQVLERQDTPDYITINEEG